MHLTFRPAQAVDAEFCLRLLPSQYVCEPESRSKLRDVWRRWLADGAMKLIVIEQDGHTPESRIAGFGSSVFVTDEFVDEASASAQPMSSLVMRRYLDGESPVLGRNAIGRANASGGVNLFILAIGWDATHLCAEEIRWVKAKIFEAFFFTHGGYNVKYVMQEVYSEEEVVRGRQIGVRLLADYERYFHDSGLPLPAPSARPFLIGARREDVQDGSALSPLFLYVRPRFSFRPGEQDMLLHALLGDSDDALASCLAISLSTIHKRWQAIYEQVASIAPEILPLVAAAAAGHRRGAEKRPRLLTYLRSHLEELRPYDSSALDCEGSRKGKEPFPTGI